MFREGFFMARYQILKRPAKANKSTSNLGVWLTFCAVLINGGISIYNSSSARNIEAAQNDLASAQATVKSDIERLRVANEQRQQDLSRFEFVKDIIPKTMSANPRESATFLALVEFTLSEAEFIKLANALSASVDKELREIGDKATETINTRRDADRTRIEELFSQIESDERALRVNAMNEFYSHFMDSPELSLRAVAYIDEISKNTANIEGRLNALYLLLFSEDDAWNFASANSALDALAKLKRSAETVGVGPSFGPQTHETFNRAVARLQEFVLGRSDSLTRAER